LLRNWHIKSNAFIALIFLQPANVFTIGGNFSNPKDMVFENPFDFDDEENGCEKSGEGD
jgi:hypothetical protein